MPGEMIPPARPTQLTPSAVRAVAVTMATGANPTIPPHTISALIDLLDGLSRTVLVETAGLSPQEALYVLDYLWTLR